ncbi:MAG: protein-glutamate O-methyltransferase CheR [Gammaproteobacteria bacterium]|nr:protein-glutamate O-methyltransferase CheR [Gammaproteobacteria bacterium]
MSSSPKQREFLMSDRDFNQIRAMAAEHTGISLSEQKKEMIYSRLARRVRALNMESFSTYIQYLEKDPDREMSGFVNAITTNLTSFFREDHHFEYLSNTVFPEIAKNRKTDKRVRIWSAGCSTGEEPYSLAITLLESKNFPGGTWDVRVLATDLDTDVLKHGQQGDYDLSRVEGINAARRSKWFEPCKDKDKKVVHVNDKLKKVITFNQLNLMKKWPMSGKFDVIFCRNVVIYFDKKTQKILFDRYAEMLEDGGYLFIGHSESLHAVTDRFESLGRTIYRKIR